MSATKRNAAICDIEDDPDIMKEGTKERRKVKKKKKKKKKEKRRWALVTLPPPRRWLYFGFVCFVVVQSTLGGLTHTLTHSLTSTLMAAAAFHSTERGSVSDFRPLFWRSSLPSHLGPALGKHWRRDGKELTFSAVLLANFTPRKVGESHQSKKNILEEGKQEEPVLFVCCWVY